ncbi:MAG TPA: alkaline phosphatase D family protein [Chitinophagales bacterium]|nr:alkaline phosphatase D family protein [Chitinophagales bacterium]
MPNRSVITILFCWLIQLGYAQYISITPVVGAVTSSSAKILFLSDKVEAKYFIHFFTESKNIRTTTFVNTNGIFVAQLDTLTPNCQYKYSIYEKTKEDANIFLVSGSFKTFPKQQDTTTFSFTLGSCTEQHHNDSIFIEMKKQQPLFFLHLGDWLYANNFNERPFYYAENLHHQRELFWKRYEMPNLKNMLLTTPMDFIFDDEDGVFDDFSKKTYTELKRSGNKTTMQEIPYPDSLRQITIEGLHTFFPSYPTTNTQAYHSFSCGNAEIFFLDTRSTRSPNTESFHLSKSGRWKYKVPKGHIILDTMQMDWLLQGLKKSTATWKFIVSGVTFNQSYKKVLDITLRAQKRILPNGMNGAYVAASLATMWFAFPESQVKLLNFCRENKIRNVIALSGDAHTAAIDNGKNAGFPELMAGGLAQKNSKLAAIIKNNLRMNLWNQGGQGIGNNNYNDAYGKVTVHGDSTVTLAAIDKYGTTICSYEVKNGFVPKHYKLKPRKRILKIRALKNLLKIALHL